MCTLRVPAEVDGFMAGSILLFTKTAVGAVSESEVAQSCPTLCDHQAPPSMGFFRQEYWSGLPFLSPGDLPDPEIKSRSPALQADALIPEPPGKPIKTHNCESNHWFSKYFDYL